MRRRLLFAVVVALVVLGGVEIAARGMPEAASEARGIVMPPHPTRGWTLVTPGGPRPLYRATDDGLRQPADPGDPRAPLVLTTGDSSIFGDGVDDGETLHDRIQQGLVAAGAPARGATLAVPGYSTEQTLAVLGDVGWDMDPRVLVVGNLWSDSNTERLRDRDLLAASSSIPGRSELCFSRSAAFRQLRARINAARGLPARRKVTWPVLGARGMRRVPLADYARNLATMFGEARERGVGVVVLALANDEMLRGNAAAAPWTPYVDVQARTAEAFGVPVVRATQVFAGMAPTSVLRDNLHPNGAGQRHLADAVVAALRDVGWPDRVPVPRDAAAVATGEDPWDGRERPNERSAVRDVLESD
jgi:hypothetical protein